MSDQNKPTVTSVTSESLFKDLTDGGGKPQQVEISSSTAMPASNVQVISGVSIELKPAPLGRRIMAFIIDMGIVSAASYLVLIPFLFAAALFLGLTGITKNELMLGVGVIGIVILGLLVILISLIATHWYFIHFETKKGATFGKKMLGLRVVSVSTGGPITRRQGIIRELVRWYIDGILGIPALISVMVTQKKQRVGDVMADTLIVYSEASAKETLYLYVLETDFRNLQSALGSPKLTPEEAAQYLAFALRLFLQQETVPDETKQQFVDWCQSRLPTAREKGVNDETLLRYFAEVASQLTRPKA